MLISIIIVNYNGLKWLVDCFDSILSQSHKEIEIIVVDNNSSDGSVKFIRKKYPTPKIIQCKKNFGFGIGNDLGVKKANGEYLLFLNTDTKLDKNCLKEMLKQMLRRKIDLAGPKILDFDNLDFYENRKLTLDIVGSLSWGKKTTMIEGCCLMIKKSVYKHLGGFDNTFFMYSEDLDLCWRAWLFGYNTKIIKSAVINHYGGGSSLPTMIGNQKHVVPFFRRYETEKNTIRMMLKNATALHLTFSLPIMFLLILGESTLYIFTGQFSAAKSIFKAIIWNYKNLANTISERNTINKSMKRQNIWTHLAKKITKFEVLRLIGIPSIKI